MVATHEYGICADVRHSNDPYCTEAPKSKTQPISLTKKQELQAKKDINSLKLEMEVHPESRGNTALHPDGPRYG